MSYRAGHQTAERRNGRATYPGLFDQQMEAFTQRGAF